MKKTGLTITLSLLAVCTIGIIWAANDYLDSKRNTVDTRIDNMAYWLKAAEKGLVPYNPEVQVRAAKYTGSEIRAIGVLTDDSPDVPVTESNTTQSENSVFADPNNPMVLINSNNSAQNPSGYFYGACSFFSFNASDNWEGDFEGPGGENEGDPSTVIGLNGRWYVNYIDELENQSCSYSDDQGASWTTVEVANTSGLADKNHMWIDNNQTSPFEGNVYVAWTNYGGENNGDIGFAYSHDDGESWMSNMNISSAVNTGEHNQGVNLSTGPNGEVYAVWAIYDEWPGDESAIGFAKSLDGGVTWDPAYRIIANIRGIRRTGTSKAMRVNSFPCATVDNSDLDYNGTIYVTWTNIGIPGQNEGDDLDVYHIKSIDEGTTWSAPIRINQDPPGQGYEHYFPWITCDEATGILSAVFYDDRNVGGDDIEVFCANSQDGGETWEDFKVSDVSSTPEPIPGLVGNYFGDYLGITAQDGWVYPTWTDNRTGTAMTYVSPYQTNPLNRPRNLIADLTFETGSVDLIWSYDEGPNFSNFMLYRNGEFITSIEDTFYTDVLPEYGIHIYRVTAAYSAGGESGAAKTRFQWGDAQIDLSPMDIAVQLTPGEQTTQYVEVTNIGQLDLHYSISDFHNPSDTTDYCQADGGGNCYISRVEIGDIDNVSGDSSYADYTNLIIPMQVGRSYPITVHNGNFIEYDRATCIVDWNGNKIFDEDLLVLSDSWTEGPYLGEIIPAQYAKPGLTRMRVRLSYGQGFDPCRFEWRGEVEDYTIDVKNWINIDPVNGTLTPGNSEMIAVNYDATGMDLGSYTTTLQFASNDPDTTLFEVDISLQINPFFVTVSADNENICFGESAHLTTSLSGMGDNLFYSWYSDPAGFTGDGTNVEVFPEVSTWYFVKVTDTSEVMSIDSVFIEVYSLPIVSLGNDTSLCHAESLTLDAGNPGSTYLWSTDETTQVIDINADKEIGTQTFFVEVLNENSCVNTDTIVVFVNPLPEVSLGSDSSICNYETWTLDAGNPGSTYLWSTGETTQTIQVSADGETGEDTYSVEVMDELLCVNTDEITITWIICTSTEEQNADVALNIFPNPGIDIINLESQLFKEYSTILEIFNLKGVKLIELEIPACIEAYKLEANMLDSGVYLCRFTINGIQIIKKIIIE